MRAMPHRVPPVFVSHGSPMIALEPGDTGAFLERLGPAIDRAFGRPRAIVTVSAHTASDVPTVLAAPRHAAVHDFGNFDPRLFRMRYDAPGDPALAERLAARVRAAGLAIRTVPQGGLDHGAWTALRYVYPGADVPVVPLAFVPDASPAEQLALGRALAPLADEGVLVLGSGSITHNLRRLFAGGIRPPTDVPEAADNRAFRDWIAERAAARDWSALADYRRRAPHAVEMHPTDEHLLPWFVAAGAGGEADPAVRLHAGATMGALGMDAYAFGPLAPALREALAPAPALA
jgi:4,5-DOPA dioxygenase extradiol